VCCRRRRVRGSTYSLDIVALPRPAAFLGAALLDAYGELAQALIIADNIDIPPHQAGNQSRRVSNGYLIIASDVDHLTNGRIGLGHRDESANRIPNIVEIPRGVNRSQLDLPRASGNLSYDGRNHRSRRLSGAVRVERPDNSNRRSK
jgi:hypothetical protein